MICDKCRLNGKVQVRGLATALKVLFIPNNLKNEVLTSLKAGEIVSLVQLYSKLSESLMILDMFKELEDYSHVEYFSRKRVAGWLISFGSALLVWIILQKVEKRK